MIKITFIGDVTCDNPLLNQSRLNKGVYNFSKVFYNTKNLFEKTEYVIGNFETVSYRSDTDYNNEFFMYNCPSRFIKDMGASGIQFVTTANNHCLDQGIAGLISTLDNLDKYGIEHTGTFRNKKEREQIKILNIGNIKIAILSYTYSTNESNTGIVLSGETDYFVGLLRKQRNTLLETESIKNKIAVRLNPKNRRLIKRYLNKLKMKLGMKIFKPVADFVL